MLQILNRLSQYANLVNLALLVSIVGWLFLLARHYKDAITEKFEARLASKEVQIQSLSDRLALKTEELEHQRHSATERLERTQDDLKRADKWHEREKESYEREIERLHRELSQILEKGRVTKERLVLNVDSRAVTAEIRAAMKEVLEQIIDLEQQAEHAEVVDDPGLFLEMAKALASSDRWMEAAQRYGKYLDHFPDDWEVQFLRGVAYVNTRQGSRANLNALRAYNEAIAFAPQSIDVNLRARLFAYRGAVLKRLWRLDEAESDLLLAAKLATADYEVHDIKYNLAAVYAMQGKKAPMLDLVRELRFTELMQVRAHLDDYFVRYADDEDLLQAIG